jgi:integrase
MGQYSRKVSIGSRWFYKFDYHGKTYRSQTIYLTKGDARKAEAERLSEVDERMRNPDSLPLFELFHGRLDYLKIKKSAGYYEENKRYFKKCLAEWGNISADQVTKKMVSDLLLKESKRFMQQGMTNFKVNALLRSLKAAFNHAIKHHDLNMKNPCMYVEFFSIDTKLKHIPSDQEIDELRERLTTKQRLLFDFVDQSGCRIMEAIRLQYSDISGNLVTLYTRKAKNSNLTPRRIPIPECLAGHSGEGAVFKDWKINPRFLEGKAKWSWHNLRHRRASIWASSGMTTFEIMTRLGHANIQTTMRYLQLLGFSRL